MSYARWRSPRASSNSLRAVCLIRCGDTVVLCNASVEERVPPHVAPGCGWVTAEYSMLPRANRQRSRRDIDKLKLSGRSAEIQRLIGRSLRAAVDLPPAGRAHHHRGLRRAAGRRRHPYRLRYRRLHRSGTGLPQAGGGGSAAPDAGEALRGRHLRRHRGRRSPCWTCRTARTAGPWWT